MASRERWRSSVPPAVPRETLVELELGFKLTLDAERASFVPGLTRSDAHSVKGTFPDMATVTKLIQVVTSFEAP